MKRGATGFGFIGPWRIQNLEKLARTNPDRLRALADAFAQRLGGLA
jgi:hypothetical protein